MPSTPSRASTPARPAPATAGRDVGARLAAESREGAVRERFVRELLARVPLAEVAEAYLFAPMRQGGVESGVAVIAARPEETDALGVRALGELALGTRAPRHTVYTGSYRLTVRGPDRGRWQVEVRAEADAPLVTLEAVTEGVRRRAGDASPPSRFDADALARLADSAGGAPA